jgi:hypothetical protein
MSFLLDKLSTQPESLAKGQSAAEELGLHPQSPCKKDTGYLSQIPNKKKFKSNPTSIRSWIIHFHAKNLNLRHATKIRFVHGS